MPAFHFKPVHVHHKVPSERPPVCPKMHEWRNLKPSKSRVAKDRLASGPTLLPSGGNHSAGASTAGATSTSGDFGVFGEVFGDDFGDLGVGFSSAGFVLCGGVPGSEADFSLSFFDVEDSEVLCLRGLDGRRGFWSLSSVAVSPLVWAPPGDSTCATSACCSLPSSGARGFCSAVD